jgi:cytoskeletal protein RodZ
MGKKRGQAALRLDQVQAQSLAELGDYLKQCRQDKGISLDQIASTTKIQRRLLQGIEDGDLTILPESIYIRGLVKRFAEALNLPGNEVAQRFPLPEEVFPQRFWISWNFGQLQPFHLYLLYVFLVFSAINGLSVLMTRSAESSAIPLQLQVPPRHTAQSHQLPKDVIKTSFPLTTALAQNPDTQLHSYQALLQRVPNPGVDVGKPVQVVVNVKEQSWMRVTVDEVNRFEGILSAGTQQNWAGNKNVTIRAGNAGGVLVAFNNQPPRPLGEAGTVEEIKFAPGKKPQ